MWCSHHATFPSSFGFSILNSSARALKKTRSPSHRDPHRSWRLSAPGFRSWCRCAPLYITAHRKKWLSCQGAMWFVIPYWLRVFVKYGATLFIWWNPYQSIFCASPLWICLENFQSISTSNAFNETPFLPAAFWIVLCNSSGILIVILALSAVVIFITSPPNEEIITRLVSDVNMVIWLSQ